MTVTFKTRPLDQFYFYKSKIEQYFNTRIIYLLRAKQQRELMEKNLADANLLILKLEL